MEHLLEPVGLCETGKTKAVDVLSQAFTNDAFHRYVLLTWNGTESIGKTDVGVNKTFFDELVSQLQDEGAFCIGISDSPMAIVCQKVVVSEEPPESNGDSEWPVPEALEEMEAKSNEVLTSLFERGRTILHIFLVGRDSRQEAPYAKKTVHAQETLRRVIQLAAQEDWPLYLEATSPYSRDLFKSVGFQVVEEVKVGIGKVDQTGRPSEKGKGVSLWVATLTHD